MVDNSTGTIVTSVSYYGDFPSVAVSDDGTTIAVANAKVKKSEAYLKWQKKHENDVLPTLISLWRIKATKLDYLGQFNAGNQESVTAIGLSPKGKTLVTSGASLRFWDVDALANSNN